MMNEQTHSVLIADDHRMIVRGIADLISESPGFEVAATVHDGAAALDWLVHKKPDIATLDVGMPAPNGLDLLRIASDRNLSTKIVLLTAQLSDGELLEAVGAGVKGIVLKQDAPETLIECLHLVARGGRWISDDAITAAMERQKNSASERELWMSSLTAREVQIVSLVITGTSNRAIGLALDVSEGTVKQHLNAIFRKLNVSNRTEMTAKALSLRESREVPLR